MLHRLSALELRTLFLKGDVSAVEIAKSSFERISRLDGQVGAFLELFTDQALTRAHHLDAKRSSGAAMGKLAGVPIAIKDNIHVAGQITTCGSRFLTNYRAPFDATVTRLLEHEDALFLGKTNCDEFAMGSSTEHSALKQTCNPWDLSLVPGGSSGGSAAAVAARLCPLALGSDTGGSIRQPAAFCGIVGFKPTYGRVSRYGLVAYGSSLDQIGPFATTVSDAALMMEIMGRQCEHDSTSLPIPQEELCDILSGDISGMTIGVPWQFLEGLSNEVRTNFENSLKVLEACGATLIAIDLSILKYAMAVYYIIASAEASTNLARFDGIRYGRLCERATNIDDIFDLSREEGFGDEVKRRIMLGTFVLSAGYQDAYYKKAQKVRSLLIHRFKEIFKSCSIIATPVSPTPAFAIGAIKDPIEMYLADIYTIPANLTGMPAISVPSGFTTSGLPLGLQLTAAQCHERTAFQAAYAFEQRTHYVDRLPTLAQS